MQLDNVTILVTYACMRVIGRQALQEFLAAQPFAGSSLKSWVAEVRHANWNALENLSDSYPKAEHIPEDRVVFILADGEVRIETTVNFAVGLICIQTVTVIGSVNVESEVAA